MAYARIGNTGKSQEIKLDKITKVCPFCHHKISPIEIETYFIKGKNNDFTDSKVKRILECPNCKEIYFSNYIITGRNQFNKFNCKFQRNSFGKLQKEKFPECIEKISPDFVRIYNQAKHAENVGLNDICGSGYRRSFEFLIKDYLIRNEIQFDENGEKVKENTDEINKIGSKPLIQCINQDIKNERIKEIGKRATWLGNDESHYIKKWEEKDVRELIKLIKLTATWIEHEILSEEIINEMSEPK